VNITVIIPAVRMDGAMRCRDALPRDTNVLIREDKNRIGCPRMVAEMVQDVTTPWVCFLGDDTVPLPEMIENAARCAVTTGCGFIALNDGIHDGAIATHWCARLSLLPRIGGYFFRPEYFHNWCDVELTDVMRYLGEYAYAENAKLNHLHPILGFNMDADYECARRYEALDRATYIQRRALRRIP
jgi:GT2 family glycosyltransferase